MLGLRETLALDAQAAQVLYDEIHRRVPVGKAGFFHGTEYAKTGKKPSGYTDTGVTLIAAKPMAGVDSKAVKTGTDLCWGKK